uniref:Uncharacterized protein n=1 Tax=Aegilops tauschii TaxID=37682 RepID=N1QVH9_AEGTA
MAQSKLVMALLVAVLAAGCCASAGAVAYLSKLPVTLDVTASPSPGQGTTVFKVTQQAYPGTGKVEYRVALDIPTATYYVRAYALDASGTQVAYGQTAPAAAFNVVSITGVTTSIKVAAGVFSTFSVVSLAFFFFIEKRKKNN